MLFRQTESSFSIDVTIQITDSDKGMACHSNQKIWFLYVIDSQQSMQCQFAMSWCDTPLEGTGTFFISSFYF